MWNAVLVAVTVVFVAAGGVGSLHWRLPPGPALLGLACLPLAGLCLRKRLRASVPDLVFGTIDALFLVIPALFGAAWFGVPGAVVGGILGDALADGIAGYFEGAVARWLRLRGFDEAREALTSSLGKMCGCLIGGGLGLSVARAIGLGLPNFS